MNSTLKYCLNCNKPITKKENKFCNSSCAATYNNKIFPKKVKKNRFCLHCGKEIINYQNKFCNNSCFQQYQFLNKTLPNFYKGKISCNETIRKVLIHLFGEKCSECNINNSWNNKSLIFEVDHIDGNSDNNFPNNLRLMCPNCHSQTETFSCHHQPKNTKRNNHMREYRTNKFKD